MPSRRVIALVTVLGALLAGCASTRPLAYQGLASASQLVPNTKDKDGHVPFSYSALDPNWPGYAAVIVEVVIYTGGDQQFGGTSDTDRTVLAAYMKKEFSEALKGKFDVVSTSGSGVLRIHLTLTGAQTSTPVLSTITKLAPAGAVLNSLQTARDKEGTFSGSVSYAVEVYDSMSDRLLLAYVAKQYPWAENVLASFGPLDASRAGIRTGAAALREQLH
jgi:hypothetical protein